MRILQINYDGEEFSVKAEDNENFQQIISGLKSQGLIKQIHLSYTFKINLMGYPNIKINQKTLVKQIPASQKTLSFELIPQENLLPINIQFQNKQQKFYFPINTQIKQVINRLRVDKTIPAQKQLFIYIKEAKISENESLRNIYQSYPKNLILEVEQKSKSNKFLQNKQQKIIENKSQQINASFMVKGQNDSKYNIEASINPYKSWNQNQKSVLSQIKKSLNLSRDNKDQYRAIYKGKPLNDSELPLQAYTNQSDNSNITIALQKIERGG